MKIVFRNLEFSYENISFLETRKNAIKDGIFTKLIYSDMFITINGIYIEVQLLFNSMSSSTTPINNTFYNKSNVSGSSKNIHNEQYKQNNYLYFYSYTPHNLSIIKKMNDLEQNIIEYYKKYHNIQKTSVFNLAAIVNKGRIKIYKDDENTQLTNRDGLWKDFSVSSCFMDKPNDDIIHNNIQIDKINKKTHIVLKIAGIWETKTEVGVTYKFIEMTDSIHSSRPFFNTVSF